jgi:hypothetical protein
MKGYIILGIDKSGKLYGIVKKDRGIMLSDKYVHVMGMFKLNEKNYRYYSSLKSIKYNVSYKNGVEKYQYNANSYNQLAYFICRDETDAYNKIKFADCEWHVYRINSRYCPVKVDLNVFKKIKKRKYFRKKGLKDKWDWNNQPFSLK